MPTSTPKLVLNGARDIPFNKLVPSAANIRKVKAGISIEELAEDIGRRGLIQSLHVRPVLDGAGVETGLFEVTAGGRLSRSPSFLPLTRWVASPPFPLQRWRV